VNYDEIYPNKELTYGETGILEVLNLTYYPQERGPYNVDANGIDANGKLTHPESRWGGIMRKTDVTNFENANYEYIEFWMMDPQLTYGSNNNGNDNENGSYKGGDLYFNLGEISEDILKDGMKSFENGLDADGDTLYTTTTVWGRVSRRTSTVYAFDNSAASRRNQDVGLNGLSSENEKEFATYKNYVERVSSKVNAQTLAQWQKDPHSPINDPAGDDFHYYRGSDYDRDEVSILNRYKYFNGTEGNSRSTDDSGESYSTAAKSTPDVEDINTDNTLNEYERYYQYHVSLRPEDLQVGQNYIESVSEVTVPLRNGNRETVRWFQFRIPIRDYERRVGAIQNFKSIRFMRMFMTGWQQEQTLRFATLELVRSDWRNYTASTLTDYGYSASGKGKLATSTVNIEENAGSYPVNYVLPPGVDRIVDPGQSTATQLNEQSMVLSIENLEPHDALAVYKNSGMDLRQYENVQLFVHGEALVNNETNLGDGDLSLFIRLGSDYKDNYYEYEVPIRLTAPGSYNNNSSNDRLKVWPKENMIDLELKKLTNLKKERNAQKQMAGGQVSYTTLFSLYDEDNRQNKMTVIGNPSLSEVGVIMIGIRNTGKTQKSGKVWVNELRVNGIDEGGGWAARGNATLRVSDLATLNAAGSYTSVGWGNIEQSAADRSLSEDWEYNVSGQTDIGKWLPKQLKLQAPLYYSRSKSVSTPKYDPYNEDLLIEETLDTYQHKSQKDSILELTQTVDNNTSFSLSGVKVNVKGKKPMPWDPANLSMSYSQNTRSSHDPTTEYERTNTYKGSINYQWAPYFKPWKPFNFDSKKKEGKEDKKGNGGNNNRNNSSNSNSSTVKFLKDYQINWLPNSISMSSNVNRTYHEEQLRNVETYESDYTIPLSYSKTFTWLRQSAISWDLTKTIKLNFNSATNARIDEPNDPVNKRLYPDEFEAWRDTVIKQLWTLGTPVDYNQTFDATWTLPINKIKTFDWITSSVKYKSNYQWNRGTRIDENTETGGSVQNQANWQGDIRLNFETLYNKSPFLKKANDRFKKRSTTKTSTVKGKNSKDDENSPMRKGAKGKNDKDKDKDKKTKEWKKSITLNGSDTTLVLKHNLNTKRIEISAIDDASGHVAKGITFKKKDGNTIELHTSDSLKLNLVVKSLPPLDDESWYKTLQVVARGMMLVRSAQVTYKQTADTYLPSWKHNAGDYFGQTSTDGIMAPGMGFAFGLKGGEEFTQTAIENDWVYCNDSLTTPAVYNSTRDMSYQAVLEPLPGLKINLTGSWKKSEKQSHQFMFDDMTLQRSGTMQMTTIAIGSAFGGTKQSDKYSSEAFNQLLRNRHIIYRRILDRYTGSTYPQGGFMRDLGQYAGMPFDKDLGESRLNSSDVLVPAFLAAYTNGGSAETILLSPFPSMLKALPNWRVNYDGLLQLFPKLGEYFKTLTLSHAYTCTYSVGNYNSFSNYAENDEGLGFVLDLANNVPVPSSAFDISTVTLTESFSPLLGLNIVMHNGLTAKAEYKQTRTEALNMSAAQLVENINRDFTFGTGYKVVDFGQKMGWTFEKPSAKEKNVSHDLNLKCDVTYRNQTALLRKIEDAYTEATSGNKAINIRLNADYQFSKMLSLKLYWQKQINKPLISTSYPTINTDFGLTMSFSLTR